MPLGLLVKRFSYEAHWMIQGYTPAHIKRRSMLTNASVDSSFPTLGKLECVAIMLS